MAVHPLRPATHLSLGRPLPYQLANRTQAHLQAPCGFNYGTYVPESHAVLDSLSRAYSPLEGRLPTCYSPVRHSPYCYGAFDLHVLGTPPTLTLSQDQTLQLYALLRAHSEFENGKLARSQSLRFLIQRSVSLYPREKNLPLEQFRS